MERGRGRCGWVFNRWDHRLDGRVLRTVRGHGTVTIAAIETTRPAA